MKKKIDEKSEMENKFNEITESAIDAIGEDNVEKILKDIQSGLQFCKSYSFKELIAAIESSYESGDVNMCNSILMAMQFKIVEKQ